MRVWVFVLVLIGLYFAGIGIEYYGRSCPKCVERRKKLFGRFYKNNPTDY